MHLVLHVPKLIQLLISIFSITALTRQRALAAPRLAEHASRGAKSGGEVEKMRGARRRRPLGAEGCPSRFAGVWLPPRGQMFNTTLQM